MSYRVLALKWRPQRFREVAGQSHVSRILSNALLSNRAAHAYLFTGPRGIGKTSMARILAKALNCETETADGEPCCECAACVEIAAGSALDVIEIDGASNRGIDDIRDLREGVRYTPARMQKKVYIIDEVHMLTQDAFNALLKTLEEPPDHVVFILATTEVLKIPQTILSRCQRFDFARLRNAEASARLQFICEQEGIEAERDALALIALKGEGSMRDALTMLDQVVATGLTPIDAATVREVLGVAGRELFFGWGNAIRDGSVADVLASLGAAVDAGANLNELAEEFTVHLRNLLVAAVDDSLAEQIEGTDEDKRAYREQAADLSSADVLRFCRIQMDAVQQMRRSSFPRVHQEVALAEMCSAARAVDLRRYVDSVRQHLAEPRGPVPKAPKAAPSPVDGSGGSVPISPKSEDQPELEANSARESEREPEPAVAAQPGPIKTKPAVSEPVKTEPARPGPGLSAGAEWEAVLALVRERKPSIQGFLSGSSARKEGNDLEVRLPADSTISLEILKGKDNLPLIVGAVEEAYCTKLNVRFHEPKGSRSDTFAPARSSEEANETEASEDKETNSERIQRIVDRFDGDVLA